MRLDVPVDAYLPADYVPFEAAKIDVHRRVAAREPGELRAIRDELSDRFGPPPAEAENLLELQRARIELGAGGAQDVEFRGGRLSIADVELDSEQAGALRERVPGAIYEWREQTLRRAGARRARRPPRRRSRPGGGAGSGAAPWARPGCLNSPAFALKAALILTLPLGLRGYAARLVSADSIPQTDAGDPLRRS